MVTCSLLPSQTLRPILSASFTDLETHAFCLLKQQVFHLQHGHPRPRHGGSAIRPVAWHGGLGEEAIQTGAVVVDQLNGSWEALPILDHDVAIRLPLYTVVVDSDNRHRLTRGQSMECFIGKLTGSVQQQASYRRRQFALGSACCVFSNSFTHRSIVWK